MENRPGKTFRNHNLNGSARSEWNSDGDHIYAVVKSTAENHCGKVTMLTAPNPNAQADLLLVFFSTHHADAARAISYALRRRLNPKILPDNAISHSDAGGLSTVIALPASSEPNSQAFQSWVPACAAAA